MFSAASLKNSTATRRKPATALCRELNDSVRSGQVPDRLRLSCVLAWLLTISAFCSPVARSTR